MTIAALSLAMLATIGSSGCGVSKARTIPTTPPATIYGFLVEIVAASPESGYPQGEKHAAIALITADDSDQAFEALAHTVYGLGWKLANILKMSEGLPAADLSDTPELAAAIEAAQRGNNVLVVFSEPIPAEPPKAGSLPPELLRP